MLSIVSIIIAYLIGSLSTATIVCKVMNLPDPRTEGSGNPGATNVFRIGGTLAGIMVLVGDALKGIIAVAIGALLHVHGFMLGVTALAVVLGHIYPVFFRFKGGKGVATAVGAILALNVTLGLLAIIVWLVVAIISRYVALASISAIIIAAILSLFIYTSVFLPLAVMAGFVFFRHTTNIQRIKNGTESKIKFRKKS